jgi:hypothetical protein
LDAQLQSALPLVRKEFPSLKHEMEKQITWLKTGPDKQATNTNYSIINELFKRVVTIRTLLEQVEQTALAENAEQRAARHFELIRKKIEHHIRSQVWEGRWGPAADLYVDKKDTAVRDRIVAHFGKDQVEIPGHETKDYPGKIWTVHVLHIPDSGIV